jgi:putative hydrolase of HD superfamily
VSGSQRDITGFRYEIGLLKRYPRTGWSLAGVPDAESVAEHSFRASVVASVLAALEGADSMIRGAVAEYEAGQTPEARAARDADKLECLLQAREYADQGHQNLQPWIDSSLASLRTATAREIAAEALTQNSLDWLTRARQP